MKYVLITGSSGLVGSEAVNFFIKKKFKITPIQKNQMFMESHILVLTKN